ncbi:hypothetical protein CR205_05730 [Alteribacter lacisalsi]|uniref:Uncharacterized protein n=1 Tax=Alteribacter lacisalsi TaxID=2045244 RepID=A0A2W0H8B0_9BACI|nr:hypothetical protein [Alteribacter lacisalsi]PYZ98094.1 hypothetical protein CR205_05730 [Alteribacter lacisalsi]
MENLAAYGIRKQGPDRGLLRIRVTGYEYTVVQILVYPPHAEKGISESFRQAGSRYKGREMVETAMRAAFAHQVPFYCAEVQRKGKDIYLTDITKAEEVELNRASSGEQGSVTFGADAEYMLKNMRTGRLKALPVNSGEAENEADGALIRHGYAFSKPVFELHPDPAKSGEELYQNLIMKKKKLMHAARKSGAQVTSGANPHGRFMLGGHFHFGNKAPSFNKTAELDAYLAIPYCLIEQRNDAVRRMAGQGFLGNVRVNCFGGFEYRTLSSWVERLDEAEPLFCYLDWLIRKESLVHPPLEPGVLKAYYHDDKKELYLYSERLYSRLTAGLNSEKEKEIISRFFDWIEHFYSK